MKFKGIFPAIITPLDENENLNINALEQLIEKSLLEGVSGFYVGGSTGESFLLSDEQRMELVQAVCDITAKRANVIANIGTFSTRSSIKMAEAAGKAGVDAISAVPPFYFPYNKAEIKQFYYDIQGATGLPMIIYNVPNLSGVKFGTNELIDMLSHDGIAGIKQTTYDLYQTETLVRTFPEKSVFCGHDEILLSALSAGAEVAIGSTFNIMGKQFVALKEAFDNGDINTARVIQGKANEMIDTLLEIGIFKAIKGVLKLQGIDCGNCMKPFIPLTTEEYNKLEKAIEKLNS